METAGVTLAILPLIVNAIEHYGHALEPFKTFVHFNRQVDRFRRTLEFQKRKFRVSCTMILESAIEEEQVALMLRDTTNELWKDKTVDNNLLLRLGDSKPIFLSAIQEIIGILEDLSAKAEKYNNAIQSDKKSFAEKARRQINKTKFSFSQDSINKALDQLQNKTDQLICLYDETEKLDKMFEAKRNEKRRTNDLKKFSMVQEASRNMYQALAYGCMEHTEHVTGLCLEAVVREEKNSFTSPSVKLELNYTSTSGLPCFFSVESGLESGIQAIYEPNVREGGDMTSESSNQPVQDISGNLCDHLQSEIDENASSAHPIGVLKGSNCPHVFIYRSLNSHSDLLQRKKSLLELLRGLVNQGRSARISYATQIRLTRQLSTALLQYYTTPWIVQRWKSGDIYFHTTNEVFSLQDADQSCLMPHVGVRVHRDPTGTSQQEDFPLVGIAPNEFLYGLGIMLIEIAHSTPMSDLVLPDDAMTHGSQLQQWHAARRLAVTISRHMGIEYGEIVRKCLRSNFACACDDLSDPRLQEAFHSEVIVKLQALEQDLPTLQI